MRNNTTNKRQDKYIHRLVAENFLHKPNEKYNVVNHIDCNRQNNDVSNLEWTNYKGNNKYSMDLGHLIKCEKTGKFLSGLN